jgi:predicted RNase H-like HicB family nuclease
MGLFATSRPMDNAFSAVFQRTSDGYIAYVEELPGANSQGRTLEEARDNLREAIDLILLSNRELTESELTGKDVHSP